MLTPSRTVGVISSLSLVQLLAACDGNDVQQAAAPASTGGLQTVPAPSAPLPLPLPATMHGHFRGAAAIGEPVFRYYVEGLLTIDGEVRLYIGGPGDVSSVYSGGGIPAIALDPAEATQFVGNLTWNGDAGSGDGVVIGQDCAPHAPGRFCTAAAHATISVSRQSSSLKGEIRVETGQGMESWHLDIGGWSIYYPLSAAREYPRGLFSEHLAVFDASDAIVINLDGAGRLFFQSPWSGCTGNGALRPHADGRVYVFDVDLVIENCAASYAHLNRAFEGLATETQDNYWGYDDWLVMVLSTPEGPVPRLALTMISAR